MGVSFDCSQLYKTHFWPLSEKTSRFNFCRVSEGVTFFFRVLDLPIFNINRLSYISQAKSMLRLFKYFFNKNFKKLFGNSRFEHSVPKNLENVIFTVVIVGPFFEKKKFFEQTSSESGWFRDWVLVLIARNCTKPISDLSVKKISRFIFCGVSGGVTFFFEFWIYQSSLSIHCLIYHKRRVCCAFSNVFSTKILNVFFGNSRFEHSVPKKLENVIIAVVIVGLIIEK